MWSRTIHWYTACLPPGFVEPAPPGSGPDAGCPGRVAEIPRGDSEQEQGVDRMERGDPRGRAASRRQQGLDDVEPEDSERDQDVASGPARGERCQDERERSDANP